MTVEPIPAGSVEFREYLLFLRRQWLLVLVVTLLLGGAATVWSLQRTPVYEATASVLVRPITSDQFDPNQRPDQLLNMTNERQVVLSSPVAAKVGQALKSKATPQELLQHVAVDVPAKSQILAIHYDDLVPLTAQRGANEFAKGYLDARKSGVQAQLDKSTSGLQRQIDQLGNKVQQQNALLADPKLPPARRLSVQASKDIWTQQMIQLQNQIASLQRLNVSPGSVIQPASLPTAPAKPKHAFDIGLGVAIGLALGVLVAFVRDRSDEGLRGREDLAERLDRPVLAAVPRLRRWRFRWRRKGFGLHRANPSALVTLEEPKSPAAEAYRTLRARLTRLAAQLDLKTIMVVSGGVAEGKSTTAANLAVVLAESGRDVLLVSADLRRPRIHQFFSLENKTGLSTLLADGTVPRHREAAVKSRRIASALWSVAPNLWVILSGPTPPHPSTLMDSDAMREFLKEQRDLFDFVVFDCPPALVVSDSLALAPLMDGVLVVADGRATRRESVSQLRDQLDQIGGKVIGAVLNRSKDATYSSYYYDEYAD